MIARLLPDLNDELITALGYVEELLLEVAAWEEDDPGTAWPPPLPGRQALKALRRIWDAIASTRGNGPRRQGAPGGYWLQTAGMSTLRSAWPTSTRPTLTPSPRVLPSSAARTPLPTSARPLRTAPASPTTTAATMRAPGWS